jgi:ABC-2 type transport system ATP-binding protein
MPNAVEVSGLRKSYGRVDAVRDVGFTVGYGEIVALLGPNGAGKPVTGLRHSSTSIGGGRMVRGRSEETENRGTNPVHATAV